jgi:hypothetical protein
MAGVNKAHLLSAGQAILKYNSEPETTITTIYTSEQNVKQTVEQIINLSQN